MAIIAKIQEFKKQVKQQDKSPVKNPFLDVAAQIRAQNPSMTDDEVVIKTMDQMKENFFQTFTKTTDDESMTSARKECKRHRHQSIFLPSREISGPV